jgi:hypothetical protein
LLQATLQRTKITGLPPATSFNLPTRPVATKSIAIRDTCNIDCRRGALQKVHLMERALSDVIIVPSPATVFILPNMCATITRTAVCLFVLAGGRVVTLAGAANETGGAMETSPER